MTGLTISRWFSEGPQWTLIGTPGYGRKQTVHFKSFGGKSGRSFGSEVNVESNA